MFANKGKICPRILFLLEKLHKVYLHCKPRRVSELLARNVENKQRKNLKDTVCLSDHVLKYVLNFNSCSEFHALICEVETSFPETIATVSLRILISINSSCIQKEKSTEKVTFTLSLMDQFSSAPIIFQKHSLFFRFQAVQFYTMLWIKG